MHKDFNPAICSSEIIDFLRQVFQKTNKHHAVIAVSGGIDSAVSLTLLTRALGNEKVFALLLPYGDQDMTDARITTSFNRLTEDHIKEMNILSVTQAFGVNPGKQLQLGNLMARVRMIYLFNLAKELDALVCGTENKSEKYLGYFTRFGDEASDIEPIAHLYKTQVRQLAEYLNLPAVLLTKPPSAELWPNQIDETELGFTYDKADLVLEKLIDEKIPADKIQLANVDSSVVKKVVNRVESQAFKQRVPYRLSE